MRSLCSFTVLLLLVTEMDTALYWTRRQTIIERERQIAVGGDVILNDDEIIANEIILAAKHNEYAIGRQNSSKFLASRNFIEVKGEIETSKVFELIKRLPKGCSLHTHLFAAASFDYVYDNLTYRENIYVCDFNGKLKLKFLTKADDGCELLAEKRNDPVYERWLRAQLFLDADRTSINDAWDHFKKIFTATYDLFLCKQIFVEYILQVLKEHYDDNVFYVELRGPFVELYDLGGKKYDVYEFVDILVATARSFEKDHPKFFGLKYIYAPYRKIDRDILRANLLLVKELMTRHPGFIVGVDFVGFEEDAPLAEYVDELRHSGLQYFFHAGETNWYGNKVDHNIVDAILLGSKRIGHAFALPKHPELLRLIRKHDIAIEISPISNQVLKLVNDLRNHPGGYFIAQGLPVVVCNDDPGNWGAVGLSYDWYLVFMAMTSEASGLEVLKKLAMNSIEYSGMSEVEKITAKLRWETEWEAFIDYVIQSKARPTDFK